MRRGESGINAVIGVDKPAGLTSHDVVNRVRRATGERRVGHAGTLDPAATGVMVVGIGQGARLLGLLGAEDKEYEASIAFGRETTTDDAEGQTRVEAEVPERLANPALGGVLVASLVGKGEQVPPSYSAISVGGMRSYARARSGEDFELEPRPYEVFAAELLAVEGSVGEGTLAWRVRLKVSKGCYVRALARDLGRSMGTAAHLAGLRRTASGSVGVGACVSLDALAKGRDALRSATLDPAALLGLPVRKLSAREAQDAGVGKALLPGHDALGRSLGPGERVSLVRDSALVGVWQVRDGRLRCEVNVPQGIEGVR